MPVQTSLLPQLCIHALECDVWVGMAEVLDQVLLKATRDRVQAKQLIAFSLDDSTDCAQHSCMVLHVYFLEDWHRESMLVALPCVEGPPTTENLISHALHTLEHRLGLTAAQLSQCVVMVAADGASVLQGKSSGLKHVQQQAAPYAQPMQCMAHRVDLCAGVLDRHSLMEVVAKLVSGTYSFYCRSSARKGGLEQAQVKNELPVHAILGARAFSSASCAVQLSGRIFE